MSKLSRPSKILLYGKILVSDRIKGIVVPKKILNLEVPNINFNILDNNHYKLYTVLLICLVSWWPVGTYMYTVMYVL